MTDTSEKPTTDEKIDELINHLPEDEKLKWHERFLKLEFARQFSKTILQIIKDFSKWAVMLMSGVGSIVGGFYSIRKAATKSKIELKTISFNYNTRSKIQSDKDSISRNMNQKHINSRLKSAGAKSRINIKETPKVETSSVETIKTTTSVIEDSFFKDPYVVMTFVSILILLFMLIKLIVDKFKGGKKNA